MLHNQSLLSVFRWVDSIGGGAEQFCEQWVLDDRVTEWQTLILT